MTTARQISFQQSQPGRRAIAVALWGLLGCLAAERTPGRAAEAAPAAAFRFAEVSERSLGLWDGTRPVLVYNHGVMSKPGVPADRARSTYVHPLYGLDGEVLTDDFPPDHFHHRGLFWAWPHVRIGEQEYDLWTLKGIRHQFERWLERRARATAAILRVENGWYVGGRKVVQERVRLRVHPATAEARAVDVEGEWTPLQQPLTLTGAAGKGYGGLTLRFAAGTNTAITIPAGLTREDLLMTNLPWADLTRLWDAEKQTSGAAIFVHPRHPDFPLPWMLRQYGVLCVGWPGVRSATIPPGQTVRCAYRVWIHRGPARADQLARAYGQYTREVAPGRRR